MEKEATQNQDSILLKCSISKREVMDQVWIIYNETIPMTEKQSKMRGKYSQYSISERIYTEFEEGSNEYVQLKESEQAAWRRYEQFKEIIKKDLDVILKKVCKPLRCYQNSKKTPQLPVLVAATFAAIWDMRKYNGLTPTQMLGINDKELEETVDVLIAPSVDYVLNYYDEDEYFLKKIIENLKYFFNIAPEVNETNKEFIRNFNYKIFESDGRYRITTKEKNNDEKPKAIDKDQVISEINEFRSYYVTSLKRQAKMKKNATDTIEMVDQILQNYSSMRVKAIRARIMREVSENYFFNCKDSYESKRVYPLDFTESRFKDCHYMLDTALKRQFYGKRNENREFFEKNGLIDEDRVTMHISHMERTIITALTELNETIHRECQSQIENFKIRSDY